MHLATLTHEIHQPIRHINQRAGGGSYVAIFTLRMTPDRASPDVTFRSEASDPHLVSWIESAIERGIRDFVEERKIAGRPVGCFHVVLTDIEINPADLKELAFKRAAFMAMTQAFDAHETLTDYEETKK